MTSAPKGAQAATTINQEAQHAISTYEAARDAICSMLGLHHAIRPGPPLGVPEASTTDMATESPSWQPRVRTKYLSPSMSDRFPFCWLIDPLRK
ncbi:hypothetical protein V6N13_004684 [Hibiscus sabdariffa]